MSRPPLKLVEWEDAYSGNHEWITVESIPLKMDPLIVATVGFELRRDEKHVTLAMSYDDSREGVKCSDLMTIPLGMIRKERLLR